jgi:hypothetical protein
MMMLFRLPLVGFGPLWEVCVDFGLIFGVDRSTTQAHPRYVEDFDLSWKCLYRKISAMFGVRVAWRFAQSQRQGFGCFII